MVFLIRPLRPRNLISLPKSILKSFSLKFGFFSDLQKLDPFFNYSIFDLTFQSWMEKNDFSDYYYSKGIFTEINYILDKNFMIEASFTKHNDTSAGIVRH